MGHQVERLGRRRGAIYVSQGSTGCQQGSGDRPKLDSGWDVKRRRLDCNGRSAKDKVKACAGRGLSTDETAWSLQMQARRVVSAACVGCGGVGWLSGWAAEARMHR